MKFSHLGIFLGLVLLPGIVAAQEAPSPKLVPALGWDHDAQSAFPTSVALDAQNNAWVGTEDKGVWRYSASEKKWTQFTTKDGLGDDSIYALALDKLGRVWVGHLNHGVSVWNGAKWRNYGMLDGPLGDHVFAIATSPVDGDVWIATDCGAARYSLAKDEWDYVTCNSGLPSNQIQCITFDAAGNVYLGTQCDGIAIANSSDNYQKWKIVTGPLKMPAAPEGKGLPDSLLTGLFTRHPTNGVETVVATTPNGIATTSDHGENWTFLRGENWADNVNGLFNAPQSDADVAQPKHPLLEDWVTCVAQDSETNADWVGYRRKGIGVRKPDGETLFNIDTQGLDTLLVRSILLRPKSPPLIAVYDPENGGLKTLDDSKAALEPGAPPPQSQPPLPAPAKPPAADTISPLVKRIVGTKSDLKPGEVVFLGDDWRTQGDWVGRYGGSYTALYGLDKDGEYINEPGFATEFDLGPHHKNSEVNPYELNASVDDLRVLYCPVRGHRSEAEINDSSFSQDLYPPEWEGPDLWITIDVPQGAHCMSFYFCNNDGHVGGTTKPNKLRDFDLQLFTKADSMEQTLKSPPLARARVVDFYGGVYKQFIVAGPAHFVAKVGRNHSYCTKLQGIFMDRLTGAPQEKIKPLPGFETAAYVPPTLPQTAQLGNDANVLAANDLWTKLDQSYEKRSVIPVQFPLRIWAYRAAVAAKAPAALLANWRWQAGIWTQEDRDVFEKAMAEAFKNNTTQSSQEMEDASGGNL